MGTMYKSSIQLTGRPIITAINSWFVSYGMLLCARVLTEVAIAGEYKT